MKWVVVAAMLTCAGCASMPGESAWIANDVASRTLEASAGYLGSDRGLSSTVAADQAEIRVSVDDAPDAGRLMIYEGSFTIIVGNPDDAIGSLIRRVQETGGYLVEKKDRSVTCRVPADRFDEVVAGVRGSGQIAHEHVTAQDVTREYMDIGIRLENAETSRTRLLKLLEKAEAVEAILKIEEQLRRLTDEIERMKGALRYMTERVSFSLITVSYQAPLINNSRSARQASRFPWINRVGIRSVLERF